VKRKMKVLINSALVLGIGGVFVFSAAQATAYAECPPCTTPPTTACVNWGEDADAECQSVCLDYFCEDGFCFQPEDKCICVEK